MAIVEPPDGEHLRLWLTARGYALVHLGTGEWALLEGEVELDKVDGHGLIHIKPAPDKPRVQDWAANRLTKALILDSATTGGMLKPYIYHTETRERVLRETEFDKGLSSLVQKIPLQQAEIHLEVFKSSLPRNESFVRWGMSRLVSTMRGNQHDGRWVAKSMRSFRKFFETVSYDPKLLFDSRKSVLDSSSYHGTDLDHARWAGADPDWSVSTEGFLLMGCHFMTSGKFGGIGAHEDIEAKAHELLQAWLTKYMGEGPVTIPMKDLFGKLVGQ
eukprot:7166700-Heterocapsa_arctica.AAC.1